MIEQLSLSKFQKTVWTGQLLKLGSPLYNMAFTFDIYAEIDVDIFKKAFKILVENNAVLRLTIDNSDKSNVTQTWGAADAQLELLDFTNTSSEQYASWLAQSHRIQFDLKKKSFYCALIRRSDSHYTWYFNQHHIFTDAFSFQVLFNKMSGVYKALINNEPIPEIFISDDKAIYTAALSKLDADDGLQATRVYQTNKAPVSFYGNYFKNPEDSSSSRYYFDLSEEELQLILKRLADLKLRTLSVNLDLLAFLITNFIIVASRTTNKPDALILSNIFSKRFTKESKLVAQPLLDILSKEFDLTNGTTFDSLYKDVYGLLIMRNKKELNASNAFSPFIINFFDLNFENFSGYKTEFKWHHCGHMDGHHFVRFHIIRYQKKDSFQFAIDIKDGLYTDQLHERFVADLRRTLFENLNLDPEQEIRNVAVIDNGELDNIQRKVRSVENITIPQSDYFINRFYNNAKNYPDDICIVNETKSFTYKEVLDLSLSLSKAMRALGVSRGAKVVVYLKRSESYVISVLGTLFSGACFIPIPKTYPKKRLEFIVNDVRADLVIHDENIEDLGIAEININRFDYSTFSEATDFMVSEVFYTLYTSGSSGKPKGVLINHESISNYLIATKELYLAEGERYNMPLFTSIGFDLTMTSLLLPLYTGGSIYIYKEQEGLDLGIREVVKNKNLNCFKCTPSHLKLLENVPLDHGIESIIVGGENFTRLLADSTYEIFDKRVGIYNEYGPTEATVACIVYKYNSEEYQKEVNVPIGKELNNYVAFIANASGTVQSQGVIGELCVAGKGVAVEYLNASDLTKEKFIDHNGMIPGRYYRTGDLARLNENGHYEYLGRIDQQIKLSGVRIEPSEIENALLLHKDIDHCVVTDTANKNKSSESYTYCKSCGLPSNYPTSDFNNDGICGYCRSYDSYKTKVEKYFKTPTDFKTLIKGHNNENAEYDCLMLYSGGKDSTYALGKLSEMGLRVLTFTLDNGYIPESTKSNIRKVTDQLNVDHIFGSSPHMNEIFVDSLNTHCNVCNGCFKTIYNLSLKIAYEKNIPFLITGLSRGQFFETKLSEEIFWKPMEDVSEIESTLFQAREAYHSLKDKVYEKTDGAFIVENQILHKIQIVDFYRYHDVTLKELYQYLDKELKWVRPEDTGRSTNCTINKAGIYVHKKKKGYSNYAFPYSWDVRTGHKTKDETIDEIEEYIDEAEVKKIFDEIGYTEDEKNRLMVYYSGTRKDPYEIRAFLSEYLPPNMVPGEFKYVEQIPLTNNGKVDLNKLSEITIDQSRTIIEPTTEIEELLLPIWKEVLELEEISMDDDFFALGGTSLDAIRIVARLDNSIGYELGINHVFELPNIQLLAKYIFDDMMSIIEANNQQGG